MTVTFVQSCQMQEKELKLLYSNLTEDGGNLTNNLSLAGKAKTSPSKGRKKGLIAFQQLIIVYYSEI